MARHARADRYIAAAVHVALTAGKLTGRSVWIHGGPWICMTEGTVTLQCLGCTMMRVGAMTVIAVNKGAVLTGIDH